MTLVIFIFRVEYFRVEANDASLLKNSNIFLYVVNEDIFSCFPVGLEGGRRQVISFWNFRFFLKKYVTERKFTIRRRDNFFYGHMLSLLDFSFT